MSDNSFGLKLGIEGEKQFKSALKDINSSFKVLDSELTLVSSQFDKQDKSVEAVSARSRVLNKEIEEQKKKIALLVSALENATQSFGESDKRTQAWQIQLNNAKAELNKLDKELAENEKALDDTAAGGLDLAYASDLVTDSMSALGLGAEDLDTFMDQMVKTSQKSNTSVQQLGEAILVCAGTASMTGQDLDKVNTALGVMADNGIKGAEGGTHLRNVLLSLSAPTDKGAAQLKKLGVEVFDAEGNMRQLDDVLTDLDKSMSDLSQEEKTAAIKQIFNKADIAAVNALLSSTSGRFEELNGLVLDSKGAAQEMADAMESGLAGTERSWKSSLEGLQIETGTIFANIKQKALTDLTDVVRGLTQGLAESGGDWNKIGDTVGVAIEGVLSKVNSYLPTVVSMAVGIITALVTGLADNVDQVVSVASDILNSLIGGLNTMLPQLVAVAVPLLLALVDGIPDNLPMLVNAALEMVITLANGIAQALPALMGGLLPP